MFVYGDEYFLEIVTMIRNHVLFVVRIQQEEFEQVADVFQYTTEWAHVLTIRGEFVYGLAVGLTGSVAIIWAENGGGIMLNLIGTDETVDCAQCLNSNESYELYKNFEHVCDWIQTGDCREEDESKLFFKRERMR